MQTFEHKRVLVTGGSRGLGLGVVEALVARHADVTVRARDVRPSVLVLNAGAMPTMAPLDAHTWESFSSNWNTDVKATFHWVQAALRFAAREWEPRAALLEWGRTGRLAALRVVARAVVDPIGLGGMRSERPRPSLRILVAGSAREARRVRPPDVTMSTRRKMRLKPTLAKPVLFSWEPGTNRVFKAPRPIDSIKAQYSSPPR
jgi:hypothetical protein